MQRWSRALLAIAVAAGLVVLLVLGLRPSPVLVDVERLERGPLTVAVQAEGRARVMDRHVLSAPVAAHSRRVGLDVGDRVDVGDLVVMLDPLPSPVLDVRTVAQARAQVAAAESGLATAEREKEAAQSRARFAAAEHLRLRSLMQDGFVSASQVELAAAEAERAYALFQSAEFRVETARHELEAARTALEFAGGETDESAPLSVRAPVPGYVLARHYESARVLQAGEPIIEIGDPARLEVVADVLSADAVRIRPGMPVELAHWGGEPTLRGEVRRVEPVAFTRVSALGIDEQRVNVIVEIRSPREEWERLGHGYRLDARFLLWHEDDTLQAPVSAVFRVDGAQAVFVLDNGRASLRRVEAGRRGGLRVQVLAGLDEGEEVIVHPPRELTDGDRVRRRAGGAGSRG